MELVLFSHFDILRSPAANLPRLFGYRSQQVNAFLGIMLSEHSLAMEVYAEHFLPTSGATMAG
jgi:hypothetical protein